MKPSKLSIELRHIADRIDRSSNPSKKLVKSAISSLLNTISTSSEMEAYVMWVGGENPDSCGVAIGFYPSLGTGSAETEIYRLVSDDGSNGVYVKGDPSDGSAEMIISARPIPGFTQLKDDSGDPCVVLRSQSEVDNWYYSI